MRDLVRRNYAAIAADGRTGRLTQEEIVRAIEEYGRTLVEPPDELWDLVTADPLDANANELAVDVPLWTAEEGRSDLSLSLRVIDDDGNVRVFLEDIHVL